MGTTIEDTRAMLRRANEAKEASPATPLLVYELFVDFLVKDRTPAEASTLRKKMDELRQENQKLCEITLKVFSVPEEEREDISNLMLISWCQKYLAREWRSFRRLCAGNIIGP